MDPETLQEQETAEPESVSWFDEADAQKWNELVRKNRFSAWTCGPVMVAALFFPPAIGLLLRVFVRSVLFLRAVKKWNVGFAGPESAATALVTEESVKLWRPDGTKLEIETTSIEGYTFDLRKQPTLTFYLPEGSTAEFRVYFAEASVKGVWKTLDQIEAHLPKNARRERVFGTEAPTAESSRKDALALVWSGLGCIAVATSTIAIFARWSNPTPTQDGVMTVSLLLALVGLVLLAYSCVVQSRSRRLARKQSVQLPGTHIATFEPNLRRISVLRALGWILLVFGALIMASAAMNAHEFWMGFVMSPAAIALSLIHFHLAAVDDCTIVLTDQYVGVVRGQWCTMLRHGQYRIYRGSFWFRRYVKFPKHAFLLSTPKGAVCFPNRRSIYGFSLKRIAEFSREAADLAANLGID